MVEIKPLCCVKSRMMYLAAISFEAFVAPEFNEIFPGRQPRQDLKVHNLTRLSVQMMCLAYLLECAHTPQRKHGPSVWT
jgi:hypothetical protein